MMIKTDIKPYDVATIDYDDFPNCPEDYKHYVIRILSIQAYAERMGATEMGHQLRLAPDYITRRRLAKIVYDEASHAYLLYEILNHLNVSEREAILIAKGEHPESAKTNSLDGPVAVGNDNNTWIDIVFNNFFLDRAGMFMVANFAKSSFKPWAKACELIHKDELWHVRFGQEEFEKYLSMHGTDVIKDMFALWYIRALNFFGSSVSRSHEQLKIYGIKRLNNVELRQQFINNIIELLTERDWLHLLPEVSADYPYQILQCENAS